MKRFITIDIIKDIDFLKTNLKCKLGIPPTQLQEGGLVGIDFKISDRYKVEVPSGNEFGTNDLWLPGGKLPNGKLEAIIKTEGMVKDIDYTIKDIY